MLLAARGGAHPQFVNTLNLDCGCDHIARYSAPSEPTIPEVLQVFVLGIVVAYLFSCLPSAFCILLNHVFVCFDIVVFLPFFGYVRLRYLEKHNTRG